MDAFVKATAEIEYLNPRTGSPAPGAKRFKDCAVTHQSGRRRILIEFKDSAYEIPLIPGCFMVHDKFVGEGKFGISCHTSELRCIVKVSGASPLELRLFAACVRAGRKLDPKERDRALAATNPKPAAPAPSSALSYSLVGNAAPAPSATTTTAILKPLSKQLTATYTIVGNANAGKSTSSASAAISPSKAASASQTLTDEQKAVVNAALARQSIFYTGSAGTGKSAVLQALRRALPASTTAFTASTAVAAHSIGGSTVHAFAGVTTNDLQGFQEGTVQLKDIIASVKRRRDAVARWQSTRTLVIDEISMLSATDFDILEAVARGVRESVQPFGGITLILSGDFFQLPPVGRGQGFGPGGGAGGGGKRYCFNARSWPKCIQRCMELTQVFRQTDTAFIDILNEVRWGHCSDAAIETLRGRWGAAVTLPDGRTDVIPTKLHTHRNTVDAENKAELAKLPGAPVVHRAADQIGAGGSPGMLDASCPAPKELSLKVGAQVLLLKTLDQAAGLVNGARGVVIKLTGPGQVRVRIVAQFQASYNCTVNCACSHSSHLCIPVFCAILAHCRCPPSAS